jgi:hypothetical protein
MRDYRRASSEELWLIFWSLLHRKHRKKMAWCAPRSLTRPGAASDANLIREATPFEDSWPRIKRNSIEPKKTRSDDPIGADERADPNAL